MRHSTIPLHPAMNREEDYSYLVNINLQYAANSLLELSPLSYQHIPLDAMVVRAIHGLCFEVSLLFKKFIFLQNPLVWTFFCSNDEII
ncbi:unnamed protein product [Meloidogyne enterolobii]|uniref:Uncharacterized protein n=1 Tax=Meloidogyne enterolobii TaxID=390850 RepID=A0ACB1B707_MELEN